MYKYSKGINLVAGGEKHRVYVKKSSNGKGVKGHVMVNHPTTDKGKWDTIDLTEKAGAKTVEEGKAATRKWHRENPYVSGAKSVKQYRGDENLPEAMNGMKNCGCKHPKKKYKYGTGALTIPEGSAIVTANGGKNIQALKAYKKGNYKLLNKIIDQMPEDKVSKKQQGVSSTNAQPVGAGQWTDTYEKLEKMLKHEKNKNLRAELFKRFKTSNPNSSITEDQYIDNLLTAQKQNYAMQEKYGQNALNEENWDWVRGRGGVASWKNKRYKDAMTDLGMNALNEEQIKQFQQGYRDLEDAMHDPQFEQNFGKYFKTNPTGKSDQTYRGKPISSDDAIWGNTSNRQFVQLSGYEDPQTQTIPGTTPIPPPLTPPDEEWEEVEGTKFKVPPVAMSLGETSAIANVIGKGIQSPRESYLKLDRYNYASQLPKTLREIQLAEQGSRESARDIVAGDAGRYLSQSGNLSSARMKAANDAVIQDTLARQDILNKNVDLSNTELSTNRSLKDYYDDIKRQNINDFNALSIKGGQSIDESFDNYQRMKNENINNTQTLQLMADMNPNYTLTQNPDGTYRAISRYRKKLNTQSITDNRNKINTISNVTGMAGLPKTSAYDPTKNEGLTNKMRTMTSAEMQNPSYGNIEKMKNIMPWLQVPDSKKSNGAKKAKTYKRK